jgi:hypothetical protein
MGTEGPAWAPSVDQPSLHPGLDRDELPNRYANYGYFGSKIRLDGVPSTLGMGTVRHTNTPDRGTVYANPGYFAGRKPR